MMASLAPFVIGGIGLYVGFAIGIIVGIWCGARRRSLLEQHIDDLEAALGVPVREACP